MSIRDINFVATLSRNEGRYEVQATDKRVILLDDFNEELNEVPIYNQDHLEVASRYILDLIKQGYTIENSIEDIYIILEDKI